MEKKKYPFDSVVILSRPLELGGHVVYGSLYNKERYISLSKEPHWGLDDYLDMVDFYIRYLVSCNNFFKNGHDICGGKWITKLGHTYDMDKYLEILMTSVVEVDYTIKEYDHPIELTEGDNIEDWVVSKELIERLKL